MYKVLSVAINTFRESIRDKILLSLIIIGFLLIAVSKIFVPISIGQSSRIIKDFGIAIIELFGLFIVLFIGTRILFQEIERKTIYTVMTKPVDEFEFVTGKFLGLYFLTVVVQVCLFVIFFIFSWLYLGDMDFYLLNALYFFIFEFLLLDAIVVFISSFTTPVTSGIVTLLLFFIGHLTDYLKEFVKVINAPALSELIDFLYFALPNFSVFNVKSAVVYHMNIPVNSYILAFSYSILYSLILLVISSYLHSLKEYQ